MSAAPRVRLVCCGILGREVERLRAERGWPAEVLALPTSLHADPERLSRCLSGALSGACGSGLALYGACFPGIDRLVHLAGGRRLPVENCFALLLGAERYRREQEAGAYFLLEDWARHFPDAIRPLGSLAAVREIFQGAHRYLLALTTPCTGDYRAAAREVARLTGLPLRWERVSLEPLAAQVEWALAGSGDSRGEPCPAA